MLSFHQKKFRNFGASEQNKKCQRVHSEGNPEVKPSVASYLPFKAAVPSVIRGS